MDSADLRNCAAEPSGGSCHKMSLSVEPREQRCHAVDSWGGCSRIRPGWNLFMTQKMMIAGMILLAAILPLAAVPPAVVFVFSIVFVAAVKLFVSANGQPVTFAALPLFRGPPSR